jgi:putative CocE/NonD family hydrolase
LVFATPLLTNDVEVVGPLEVKLWASSSAVDTDFTAKLIDWYPPNEDYPSGYAMILQDSILRARYRESFERQVLMTPGQIYVFSIDLWATANLFKAGHRIRLDVSSSNFPTFDVNPNTGEKIGYHTKTVVAENIIYADREHPSHIILPIIP